eukprot:15333811-Alexandrium_andersonii.AAC.1
MAISVRQQQEPGGIPLGAQGGCPTRHRSSGAMTREPRIPGSSGALHLEPAGDTTAPGRRGGIRARGRRIRSTTTGVP